MISCSREILESIEKIRKAAAKEPENLGHQVKLYVLLPSLSIFEAMELCLHPLFTTSSIKDHEN